MIASKTARGETPDIHIMVVVVSPTTLHAPPAFDAATIAAKIANVHLGPKELMRHSAPDQRGGNVVEKAGENPDHCQQDETTFPIVRKKFRQRERHTALFEVARQQGESTQKTK